MGNMHFSTLFSAVAVLIAGCSGSSVDIYATSSGYSAAENAPSADLTAVPSANLSYNVVSRHTNFCLQFQAAVANAVPCVNSSVEQKFSFVSLGGEYFQLKNAQSGLCLQWWERKLQSVVCNATYHAQHWKNEERFILAHDNNISHGGARAGRG